VLQTFLLCKGYGNRYEVPLIHTLTHTHFGPVLKISSTWLRSGAISSFLNANMGFEEEDDYFDWHTYDDIKSSTKPKMPDHILCTCPSRQTQRPESRLRGGLQCDGRIHLRPQGNEIRPRASSGSTWAYIPRESSLLRLLCLLDGSR
jgi:hypothetical protein